VPEDIRWHRPFDDDRRRLDAWCPTVGAGVLAPARNPHAAPAGDFVVVSWNVHVGGGRLAVFVRELRAGRFTHGTPPVGFVLLLQETFRGGASVPQTVPDEAPVPDRIEGTSPSTGRDDIVSVAEGEGLALLYLPSMRNGRDGNARAEDRGNAILSTFDLSEPTGVELPLVRHRRVAVAATVSGVGPGQRLWRLRVVSLHLDASTGPRQLWLFTSAERERQAGHLVDALDDDQIATIVGGDLNTWAGGTREPAFVLLRREFPHAEPGARFARWLTLDYLFFRLPPSWHAESRSADEDFGSDHRPMVSWVRLGA
jgi:endonuclease/exonuclease/phosphatase family metal-dependent hydrolase